MKYLCDLGVVLVCVGIFVICLGRAIHRDREKQVHPDAGRFPCKAVLRNHKRIDIAFVDCNSLPDVREWLNEAGRAPFLTIGTEKIIQCDDIVEIKRW